MNSINEVDKPMVKKTIVVYAGRFQPFHKGHYAAYSKLVSKFGADSVYIGTSNDQSSDKSPFNFKEKKDIATKMFGIPSSKFVQIKNPYKPVEILKKFDGQTTQYIAAVGEKDATRLQGNYFKAYNGKAGYGYDEIGYVYPVPAEANPISGTDVRNGLGNSDTEKAKKFFLKAYPKFDKDIFKLITGKLMKENFPGGIGIGLNLPGGYINGAPKQKDVDKLSKTIHKKDDTETNKDYVYDPIGQIIDRVIAEEIFNEFIENYLDEAPNTALDRDISYTNVKGKQKKIKARDALRLPKDHPAHIQAAKLAATDKTAAMAKGPSDAPVNQPNKKPDMMIPGKQAGSVVKKSDGKPDMVMPTQKKKEEPGKRIPKAPLPPPQKLSGSELKSDAEQNPNDKHAEKTKEVLDNAKTKLSAADNESIDKVNNPESEERKGFFNMLKKAASYIGNGVKHVFEHNREMVMGTGSAIKSLATTGKMGSIKDKNGKNVHWSDYSESGSAAEGWGSKMQEVPVYKKDKHGHDVVDADGNKVQDKNWLGKPKTKKVPKFRDDLTDEEKELAEKSWKEHERQKKAVTGVAKTTGLIVGSLITTGAVTGGYAAATTTGATAASVAKGAAAQIGYKFGGGSLGTYIAKDIAKHSALEALGANAGQATAGGIALGVAGIFENKDGEKFNTDKFISNYINKTLEIMQNYKLSDEQLLKVIKKYESEGPKDAASDLLKEKQSKEHYVPTTGMFNRNLTVQQKIDKLNPARAIEKSKIWHHTFAHHNPETGELEDDGIEESISESKSNSIQNFVEWATERLKLKEKPKVSLITGSKYSNEQASLGGYNPETKEIFVQVEGRLTADILRTIAHEMVHRKQDEMGMIGDPILAGKDGSSVENAAHSVAGILMREYGRNNKQIFQEGIIKEMGSKDIHLKNIITKYRDSSFRKRINAYFNLKLNANNANDVARALRNMDYGEITKMEKDLNLHNPDLDEKIEIDVNTGDTVLMGKFKNKKVDVKNIGKDQHGMPTINGKQATTFRTINEVSGLTGDDAQPDGAFLPKNAVRQLGANDGSNKSDNWFKNGGYIQTDFPIADAIFGDEDALETYINYSDDNIPRNDFPKTKFNKGDGIIKMDEYQKLTQKVLRELFIEDNLITEGGAYGHMSHPFDDMDLTFGQLKDIISKALDGELGVVREKTDGQALAISWKKGRLIAARNKGHLANAGANAMGIEGVASKFAGRGGLTDAYNFAMKDLSAAIGGLSQKQREKIFNEGKCFMNIEVIWPESVNVIPYGQALLIFHNTTCYNEKGDAVGADQSAARTLAGMIKQINSHVQSKYTIQGPPITEIPKNQKLSSKKGVWLGKLAKLQSEFGCSDSDTMAVYHQHWWENFIDKNAPVPVDKLTKESLIRRWAFGDKSFRLNTISNQELQDWAVTSDKVDVIKKQKENMKKFEEIFLGVGADVLEFVGSVLTVHPDKAIRSMKDRLKQVASQVKTSTDSGKVLKFKNELERLNSLGGVDRIVASEGLVFFYNGKTYKLTGTFAPLNQLLGIFYE